MSLLENQPHFQSNLIGRHRRGKIWRIIFIVSTIIAIVALFILLITIIDDSVGYAAITYKIPLSEIAPAGPTLENLTCEKLIPILEENVSRNRFRQIEREKPFAEWSDQECYETVVYEVGQPKAEETWSLFYSRRYANELKVFVQQKYPDGDLVFKQWLNLDFITRPQSKDPLIAGIRPPGAKRVPARMGGTWKQSAFPSGRRETRERRGSGSPGALRARRKKSTQRFASLCLRAGKVETKLGRILI